MLPISKSVMDKVLFRILKTKGQTASLICKKLKDNIRNVDLLSEDELCDLWLHVKAILVDAHKFCVQIPNDTKKRQKEHSLMIQLIHSITTIALHTILNKLFIPNILLEVVIIFHNMILPDIKDEKVKDKISYFLENWWKLDLIWKEKVIVNVLKYLFQKCESSLQHVRRLHDVQFALKLLKYPEDKQLLLKLVRNKTMLSVKEGQAIILHLFTLGEEYIVGIHQNIKVKLEDARVNVIIGYANIYTNAWLNAEDNIHKITIENCLHNLIFHCFRANRSFAGRQKLGKNLHTLVTALHTNKNNAVKQMLYNQYKTLLWKHLKAPGSDVRCNAAEILFTTHSILFSSSKEIKNINHKKYYQAMADLLKDRSPEVCIIAINGIFNHLCKHWTEIPNNFIQIWLNLLLSRMKSCPISEVKVAVFLALNQIISNTDSHKVLQDFLPNFANSIYDSNIDVFDAYVRLLLNIQSHTKILLFDIVPKAYILDRLESIKDQTVQRQLTKLMWLHISSNNNVISKIQEELIQIGMNNINTVRKLCLHSKHVISWSILLELIANMLPLMEKELRSIAFEAVHMDAESNETATSDHENAHNCECLEDDFHRHGNVHVIIDIVATLLASNNKKLEIENLSQAEKSVLTLFANMLPNLYHLSKNTSMQESIIFLFSLISPKLFPDEIVIMKMFLKELNNARNSDDVLLTIVYILVKWEKTDLILNVLSDLFTRRYDQIVPDNEIFDTPSNDITLELGQRILKHLLHITSQLGHTNYYYEGIIKFWEKLHVVRDLVKEKLSNNITRDSLVPDDTVLNLFTEYILLVPSLHREGVFDATECLSEILSWISRTIIPCVLKVNSIKENQFSTNLLKNTFSILNSFLKEYKVTPKSCCDIVLLYCGCISLPNGIIFFDEIFDAIISLLDYSKIAYANQERNLIRIVVPNFFCATMITLTKYSDEIVITHTKNLKNLPMLIEKYFSTIESTFQNRVMHLSYITIMFNTAVSSLTSKLSNLLQDKSVPINNTLHVKLPYLARKVLNVIVYKKKYLELCTQVLSSTITNYEKIDMLSALLLIYKMFKSSDNVSVKRLKNITLVIRLHNQRKVHCTAFDRSILNAMNFVIETILQE